MEFVIYIEALRHDALAQLEGSNSWSRHSFLGRAMQAPGSCGAKYTVPHGGRTRLRAGVTCMTSDGPIEANYTVARIQDSSPCYRCLQHSEWPIRLTGNTPALLISTPTGALPTAAATAPQVASSMLLKSAGTTLVSTLKRDWMSAATSFNFDSVRDTRMMFKPATQREMMISD